jgi:hypothetical protein
MTKTVTKIEPEPVASKTPVPMDLVQRAFEAGNLELVARAMELQERWEAAQARKAFDAAMAAVRAKLPIIIKNRAVDYTSAKGRTNYQYEDLAGIASQIDGVLAEQGLSYRFRTTVGPNTLTVTCVISHAQGYSEENSLSGPHDASGNKNDIQAIGSAQTYLQRYTLKAALGLAAGKDTDANAPAAAASPAEAALVSMEQADAITAALKVRNMPEERFLKWVRAAYRGPIAINAVEDVPAHIYDECIRTIRQAGDPQ